MKAKARDPNRPKSVGNVYLFFLKDFVKKNKENRLAMKDLFVLASKEWKSLPKEKADVYVEQHREAYERYLEEMREYKKSDMYSKFKEMGRLRKYASKEFAYDWEYSGYFFFIKKMFDECDMDLPAEENARVFAGMWRNLNEEEREAYRKDALSAKRKDSSKKRTKDSTDVTKMKYI